jgi:hypothetical protein
VAPTSPPTAAAGRRRGQLRDRLRREDAGLPGAGQGHRRARLEERPDVAALLDQPFASGQTVGQAVQEKIAVIKENIVIRRFARFELATGDTGTVAAYIHPPAARIGVLVELAAESADAATLQTLAKDVAMHVAASSPLYVAKDEVPADVLAKEKEIYRAQALASGSRERRRQDRRGQPRSITPPSACSSSPTSARRRSPSVARRETTPSVTSRGCSWARTQGKAATDSSTICAIRPLRPDRY